MGLDMYAYSAPRNSNPQEEGVERTELAYWRKFNALHGWMEDLYRSRGGEDTFNCIAIELFEEDLDNLERALDTNTLTPREGFFFGSLEIYPEDVESTRKFIKDARAELQAGRDVYYDSWW